MRKLLGWGLVLGAFLTGCTASRTVIVHERTTPPPVETPGLEHASRVHTRNGIRFYERRHYRKAIQQFELALAKDPSNWEAHFYLGECYRELRDWDRCLAHYHRVRDLRPVERVWVAKVEFSIGLVHERRGHLAKAREHYDLALVAVPNFEPAVKAKARVVTKKYRDDDDSPRGKGKHYNYKGKND
ncbi:MAG TPA: tetratricopeptide repeat protein [candidate division Zixibacteria bacterium]|nr:tetratricopeptide repeat protein [candidate division Zixibacteria bacterium]